MEQKMIELVSEWRAQADNLYARGFFAAAATKRADADALEAKIKPESAIVK